MRGQQVYCLRSVTSSSHLAVGIAGFGVVVVFIVCLLCFLLNCATAQPAFFIQREELDIGLVPANAPLDLQEEFLLMSAAQFTQERAILDALEAIIQTGIGNF